MTAAEKVKARLKKRMSKNIVGWWRYCGGKFVACGQEYVNGLGVQWELVHKFKSLKAVIDNEGQYGIPNSEKAFDGDEAFEEALEWIIDKIFETVEILQKRTSPYLEGKVRYDRALHGGIKL